MALIQPCPTLWAVTDNKGYSKCSKKFNTSLCPQIKCGLPGLEFLVRVANREDPIQTASLQSDMGLHCLFRLFWQATIVQNFRIHLFTVPVEFFNQLSSFDKKSTCIMKGAELMFQSS